MSCPFRRTSSHAISNGALKRSFTSRQSSVQIPNDDQDDEDKNTLNLKHLNASLLMLTAPPNEALQIALHSLLRKERLSEPHKYTCLNRLPREVGSCSHYAYLEDLYDIVSSEDDIDELVFLDKLGQELISTSCTGRLERAFMCLGGDLKEFLTTLDGVHDVLKYQEQEDDLQLQTAHEVNHEAEAFICTSSEDELQLDFTTERPAVAFLLVGSLKAIAKNLYNTLAEVTLTRNPLLDARTFRFKIKSVDGEAVKPEDESEPGPVHHQSSTCSTSSSITTDLQMGVATFCKAFPWHFVMDRRLELVQLGSGFMRLFGCMLTTRGTSVATYFEFHRPRSVTLSFTEIIKRANTPFVLAIRNLPGAQTFPAGPELIDKYAGRHERYEVITPDGYILTIFRLPPRANPKGVVLLQHPLFVDSRIWMTQSNSSSALIFWRDGWDVWMGNQRGTQYSERHVNLTSSDSTFWNWTFDEIGQNDIPTMIKFVRSKTGNSKIYYMGHSMGSTNALIYASSMPKEAQDSVEIFVLAAPACYFTAMTSMFKQISSHGPLVKLLVEALDLGPILPVLPTLYQVVRIAYRIFPRLTLITNVASSAIMGWALEEMDPQFLNLDAIMNLKNCSWKVAFHFLQLVYSNGSFTKFDYGADKNRKLYGSDRPGLHPLGDITAPVYLISSTHDSLTSLPDTDLLYDRLSPAAKIYGKLHITTLNHGDYHSGKHRIEYYIKPSLKLLNTIRSNK